MLFSINLDYVYFFGILTILNILLIPVIKVLSKKYSLYDIPGDRKLHSEPTQYLGGLFFLVSNFFLLCFYKNLYFDSNNLILNTSNIYSIIVVSSLIFFVGLLDDKVDLDPLKKTILLLSLFSSAVLIDNQIAIKSLSFEIIDRTFNLKAFSFFFTIVCIFIFVNACNMYDGADLQIGIYFSVIVIYLIYKTNYFLFFLPIIIPLIIFLFLNFNKIIFIGNNGSHFLSYIFSVLLIKFYNLQILVSVEEVLILMIIPGLDLTRLFFSRVLNNKKFFHSDLDHIHHRLHKKHTKNKVQVILFLLTSSPIIFAEIFGSYLLAIILGISLYILIIIKKI